MSRFTQNTMEEEKYIIENQNSFELKDIFECGQCLDGMNKKTEVT